MRTANEVLKTYLEKEMPFNKELCIAAMNTFRDEAIEEGAKKIREAKADIIFGILQDEDYAGGGVTAIFSTFDKAKKHYDTIKVDRCSSKEIITMKVDDPDFEGETFLSKHG